MANISFGTTDVKLCARALVNIGMKPVQDLEGDDDVTQACNILYPMVKQEVLSAYPWISTKGKVQLGRLTDTPVNVFEFGFQMPDNRLGGPLAIYADGEIDAINITDWDVHGEVVLANDPELFGDFQFDIDESKFPPYLANLTTYILSARLAESLTDDSSKADKYDFIAFGTPGEKRWGGYFEVCRSVDSKFRPTHNIRATALTDVRLS